MTRRRVFYIALFAAGAAFLAPGRAAAFERQWHVGGGIGVTAYPHHFSAGPALGLNAAYGISDVFDLKLELLGSYHTFREGPRRPRQNAEPYSAVAGVSYKLDVLRWIPYGALLVGYQHIAGSLPLAKPLRPDDALAKAFRHDDALATLVVGLDYALSREWGVGASLRTDFLLTSSETGGAFTTLLRAEYHWGF
jgi:Outer membrane protein beta-barrel domain